MSRSSAASPCRIDRTANSGITRNRNNANAVRSFFSGGNRHLETRGQCQSAFAHCQKVPYSEHEVMDGSVAQSFCHLVAQEEHQNLVTPSNGRLDAADGLWGWSNLLPNDPTNDALMECTLYMGAADCDLDQATPIGTVLVDRHQGHVTFDLDEAHGMVVSHWDLYAGRESLPHKGGLVSTDPIHYDFHQALEVGASTVTAELDASQLSGGQYLIAHAKVCEATQAIATE